MHPPAKPLVHGIDRSGLAGLCAGFGEQSFRSSQLWRWLYSSLVSDWGQMNNMPRRLRDLLGQSLTLVPGKLLETAGRHGQTRKLLFELLDGETVESVIIPARGRCTVCISSQAGCRFNCAFCASGKSGFRRNLEAGEIVWQVIEAARQEGARPSNVVFMGMGEPFDNYDNVIRAVRIINDPEGLKIGARRITISTCGLADGIARLAGEGLQIELSVSLHAPDDDLRRSLMPVNARYPLSVLIAACREYAGRTGRIITFEYTMISGVNDSLSHAGRLAGLIGKVPSRVNLIPLSPVDEYRGAAPPERVMREFMNVLQKHGINATLRASKGASLKAACGQLRGRLLRS